MVNNTKWAPLRVMTETIWIRINIVAGSHPSWHDDNHHVAFHHLATLDLHQHSQNSKFL